MPVKKKIEKKTTVVNAALPTSELSYDTKTIIVILFLLFVYPVGVIFMLAWMKTWPSWLKVLLTIPFALGILAIIFGVILLVFFAKNAGIEYRPTYRMHREWNMHTTSQMPPQQVSLSPTQYKY